MALPHDAVGFSAVVIVVFLEHIHLLFLVPSNMFKPSSSFHCGVLLLILIDVCVYLSCCLDCSLQPCGHLLGQG